MRSFSYNLDLKEREDNISRYSISEGNVFIFNPENEKGNHVFEVVDSNTILSQISTIITEIENKSIADEEYILVQMMQSVDCVSGEEYEFEIYFRKTYEKDLSRGVDVISNILKKYYMDEKIVKSVLHLISHFSYEELGDRTWPLVSTTFSNSSKAIRKFALKIFDNWNEPSMLSVLKGTTFEINWLEKYKNTIVQHLEEKIYAISC